MLRWLEKVSTSANTLRWPHAWVMTQGARPWAL